MKFHLQFARSMAAALICGAFAYAAGAEAVGADRKLPAPSIDEALSIPSSHIEVNGSRMAYLELGEGEPVLFVHGNPTSSYLWRNIMPYVARTHRAIAVDLVGMGRSDKPAIGYTFADHYTYLDGFIDALELENITLVGHDWGATLAWEYARRNPAKVVRLAFMEGVLPPAFPLASLASMGEELGGMFRALRDEEEGRKLVIERNMFVEQVLPAFVDRPLGEAAMRIYRAPYRNPEDRWSTLVWPRELPIEGEPAANVAVLEAIKSFMEKTNMPVLLLYGEPGAVVPPQAVGWYVERISDIETAFVGRGLHYLQEDQPDAIGRALADWMRRN